MVDEKINKKNEEFLSEKKEEKIVETPSKKDEASIETKKIVKKTKNKVVVKEIAVVNGLSLHISPKNSFAVCKMIKNKTPEVAIEMLQKVILKKDAVPMQNREVGHRKGMAGGRYPVNVAKEVIELLKQLIANAVVNQIENPVIVIAKANKASRPFKKGGRKAKRTHIYIEVKDKTKLNKNKWKKK